MLHKKNGWVGRYVGRYVRTYVCLCVYNIGLILHLVVVSAIFFKGLF